MISTLLFNKIRTKRGMEAWHLILLILAIVFLLFVIIWFGSLRNDLASSLDKLGDLL